MFTLCIGFVGRRFHKKYCQIHHAIISAILEAIFQKMAAFFKVIRVIFENMRQRNRHSGVYVYYLMFGNSIQIAYCYVHHTMVGTIWLAVVAICSK